MSPPTGTSSTSGTPSTPLTLSLGRFVIKDGAIQLPSGTYRVKILQGAKDITANLSSDAALMSEVAALVDKVMQQLTNKNLGDHVSITEEAGELMMTDGATKTKITDDSSGTLKTLYSQISNQAQTILKTAGSPLQGPTVSISNVNPQGGKSPTADPAQADKVKKIWHDPRLLAVLNTPNMRNELIREVKEWLEEERMNPGPEGERFGDETIADILHEPGNEALREVLLHLGRGDTTPQHVDDLLKRLKVPQKEEELPEGITKNAKMHILKGVSGEEEMEQNVLFFILNNLQRNPTVLDGDGCLQVQRFAQFSCGGIPEDFLNENGTPDILASMTVDKGWPSAFDKVSPEELVGNCTNLGAIMTDGKLSGLRAGKTYDLQRLEQSVFYGCQTTWALQGTAGVGLSPVTDASGNVTHYEYQQMMTSLMDFCPSKALFSKLKTLGNDQEENERKMLKEMLAELDKWQGDRIVYLPDPNNPAIKVKVHLKKPIFTQQMFSATLKMELLDSGEQASLQANFLGNHQLLKMFCAKHGLVMPMPNNVKVDGKDLTMNAEGELALGGFALGHTNIPKSLWKNPEFLQYQENMLQVLRNIVDYPQTPKDIPFPNGLQKDGQPITKDPNTGELMWNGAVLNETDIPDVVKVDPQYQAYVKQIKELPDENVALSLMYVMTGYNENGNEVHAADMQIYRKIVADHLNIAPLRQCKSGVDRTGLDLSLLAAQDRFKQITGYVYYPHLVDSNAYPEAAADLAIFRTYFTLSLRQFALSVTTRSKGMWGISWELGDLKSNPVPYKYLEEDLVRGYLGDGIHPFDPENPYSNGFFSKDVERAILGHAIKDNRKKAAKERKKLQPLFGECQQLLKYLGIKLNAGLAPEEHISKLTPIQLQQLLDLQAKFNNGPFPQPFDKILDEATPFIEKAYIHLAKEERRLPLNDQAKIWDEKVKMGPYKDMNLRELLINFGANPNPPPALFREIFSLIKRLGIPGDKLFGNDTYKQLKVLNDRFSLADNKIRHLLQLHQRYEEIDSWNHPAQTPPPPSSTTSTSTTATTI